MVRATEREGGGAPRLTWPLLCCVLDPAGTPLRLSSEKNYPIVSGSVPPHASVTSLPPRRHSDVCLEDCLVEDLSANPLVSLLTWWACVRVYPRGL